MKLTFLSSTAPLTKNIDKGVVGQYPDVYRFTSRDLAVESLLDFTKAVEVAGDAGMCLARGQITSPLADQSRANASYAGTTKWLLLDIDGMDISIPDFLVRAGLKDVAYVRQFSSSHGVKPGTSAHLFFELDKEYTWDQLKTWTKNLNLKYFREFMALNKSNTALKWGVDVGVQVPSKLIYIAPPTGTPPDIGKRLAFMPNENHKTTLTISDSEAVNADASFLLDELRDAAGLPAPKYERGSSQYPDGLLTSVDHKINVTAIKQKGNFTYLNLNGGDSLAYYHTDDAPEVILNFKGEPAMLTKSCLPEYWEAVKPKGYEMKTEETPVEETPVEETPVEETPVEETPTEKSPLTIAERLAHVTASIEDLREKGASEEELDTLTEYRAELLDQRNAELGLEVDDNTTVVRIMPPAERAERLYVRLPHPKIIVDGVTVVFACYDEDTSKIIFAKFNCETGSINRTEIPSLSRLKAFGKQFGLHINGDLPVIKFVNSPDSLEQYDVDTGRFNLYVAPPLFVEAWSDVKENNAKGVIGPNINKLIANLVDDDQGLRDHLINWLARIVQTRKTSPTCWVVTGVQGTGKNLLLQKIMTDILGESCVVSRPMRAFTGEFNGELEGAVIIIVDEAQLESFSSEDRIYNQFKEMIANKKLRIRGMRKDAREVDNHASIIFCSNHENATRVEMSDRRTNVAPHQHVKLEDLFDVDNIYDVDFDSEVPEFARYLIAHPLDEAQAMKPYDNDSRRQLMRLSRNSFEEVVDAIVTGDIQFFADEIMSTSSEYVLNTRVYARLRETFIHFVNQCETEALQPLNIEHLQAVFAYFVGTNGTTAVKLIKMLSHKGLNLKRAADGNRVYMVRWKTQDKETIANWRKSAEGK